MELPDDLFEKHMPSFCQLASLSYGYSSKFGNDRISKILMKGNKYLDKMTLEELVLLQKNCAKINVQKGIEKLDKYVCQEIMKNDNDDIVSVKR